MNTSLPAPSTSRGLCAAFFIAGAVRAVEAIVAIATGWSRPEIMAAVDITPLTLIAWILFALATAFVGVRLVYDCPHCVLHGLIAAWLILADRGYGIAKLVWIAASYRELMLSPSWRSGAFSSTTTALFAGVVIWLLHVLRSRHDREVSIPGTAQTA